MFNRVRSRSESLTLLNQLRRNKTEERRKEGNGKGKLVARGQKERLWLKRPFFPFKRALMIMMKEGMEEESVKGFLQLFFYYPRIKQLLSQTECCTIKERVSTHVIVLHAQESWTKYKQTLKKR